MTYFSNSWKCYQFNTISSLVDDVKQVTQQVPEMKCEKIPRTRSSCRTVPVPQPPEVFPVPQPP